MKTIVTKKVIGVSSLQASLRSNGFLTAIVASSPDSNPPTVFVDQDDGSQDPTDFVVAFVEDPTITLSSNKAAGPFGLPQALADGADSHSISISMIDPSTSQPAPWSGTILVQPVSAVPISSNSITITNGIGTMAIGPVAVPGQYEVRYQVQGNPSIAAVIQVAFF